MSLCSLIEPYLCVSFEDLPPEVQERVGEDLTPDTWDALSDAGRYLWAQVRDTRNKVERADFALSVSHGYWFKLQGEILQAECEIAELQSLEVNANDAHISKVKLTAQLAKLTTLQQRWHQPDDLTAKEQLAVGKAAQAQAPIAVDISRALQFLSESTGATWADNHLFSLVSNSNICLHAVIPPWTKMKLIKWTQQMRPVILPFIRPGREVLAVLGPDQLQEMWVSGHTSTSDDVWPESVSLDPDAQIHAETKVGVSKSELRLTKATLLSLLKKWEESRQPMMPIAPILAPTTAASPPPSITQTKSTTYKLRTNSLDVPIKKAVMRAGSLTTGAVYVHLRELALSGEPPFLGTTEGDALCYTNDKNKPAKLTKDALAKRLKKHHL